MKQLFAFALLASSLAAGPSPYPFNFHSYRHSVRLSFKFPEAAQRARPEILPLYHGYAQAFSSRWDDNNFDDLKVKELMDRHGIKGTFYLNGSAAWHGPSEAGIAVSDSKLLPALLLKGGNSIGAHSLDHEFMPSLSRNEQFYQALRLRIDRELSSQSTLSSWAYPFSNWRSAVEGDLSQRDLYEILRRAGIIHLAEHKPQQALAGPFFESTLICGDGGAPMDLSLEDYLKQPPGASAHLWSASMHAWPKPWGGKDFMALDSVYKKWKGRKGWWLCNQNEWAAYMAQAKYGKLQWKVQGTQAELSVDMPAGFDSGASQPLSVAIRGVGRNDLNSESYLLPDGTPAVDIAQGPESGLPESYDLGISPSGLSAELATQGKSGPPSCLSLRISNRGPALRDCVIQLRAPLAWEEGILERRIPTLDPGASTLVSFCPSSLKSGFVYTADRFYAAAQIDYMQEGKRRRLWSEFSGDGPSEDPSYPRQGFDLFGPLAGNKAVLDPKSPAWQPGIRSSIPMLSPEIIPAGGKPNSRAFYTWDKSIHVDGLNLHYMLSSRLHSAKALKASVLCDRSAVKGIWLNSKRCEGWELALQAGENDLTIIYAATSDSFHESQYGSIFPPSGRDWK